MSIATITAAQRVEVRDACTSAALIMQKYAQSGTTPRADETALATPVLDAAAAALTVAGASGLPATSAVVANGGTVNVENSAGNLDSPATAVVAAGVLTGVNLAATKTIVTSGVKVNAVSVTGTGNFATITVANGVITAIVLSAS
jgi:hypothetical protein